MKIEKYLSGIKPASGLGDYLKLCAPILIFPVAYFPYVLWGRRSFMLMAERMLYGSSSINPMSLLFTGNNTILLFWIAVTAVVMLISLVLGALKVRPWYIIPLYLAVMFSFCGILSLAFFTIIVG